LRARRAAGELVGFRNDPGEPGYGGERPLVAALVVECQDVVDRALVERDRVAPLEPFALDILDLHLIESRRHRLDGLQRRDDLLVLLLRDRRRDEDAQVPDLVVDGVDDPLSRALISWTLA